MIRLLFIPLFTLLLFSCDDSSKEVDPLFYQISEADSLRCMDEILEGMISKAQRKQDLDDSMHQLTYNSNVTVCGVRDVLSIIMNSRGQVMVGGTLDSVDISEEVYNYFMFNRNLNSAETVAASMNSQHEGFEKPFYNWFDEKEIEDRIERTTEEANEVKATKGADLALVNYFFSKVEEWKIRKKALTIIGDKQLPEVALWAILRFEYPMESKQSKAIKREIAFAFYQMRNYECMRYFGETYLNLFERSQRMGREKDRDKLAALDMIHSAKFVCYEWKKSNPYKVIPPPEPTP